MGTSGWLATQLDLEMFDRRDVAILPRLRPGVEHGRRSGEEVAAELGGRLFLRYLRREDLGRYRDGVQRPTYVTITPYAPEEATHWLALPDADVPREYVLLLDPTRIEWVQGPMWIAGVSGIQYILPEGYTADAVVVPGAPTGHWEMAVR